MSNNTNLSKLANVLDDASDGQYLKSTGSGGVVFDDVAAGTTTVADITALEALTASEGDMAFVTGTNGLFIKKTVGWYKIADVVNDQLNSVTVTMAGGAEKTSGWQLPVDGVTNTTATGAATDPEGLSVTWSAAPISPATLSGTNIVVSGTNVASLTQGTGANSHVFTIAPVATAGEFNFSIRFSVTDGVNAALSTDKAYILDFATFIVDSKYTTLLAQAVGSNNGTNTPITDSSSAGRTITTYGTPGTDRITQTAFTPYRRYSRNNSAYYGIRADYPVNVALGAESYTTEFWFKIHSHTDNQHRILYCDQGASSTNTINRIQLLHNTNWSGTGYKFTGSMGGTFFTTNVLSSMDPDTWYHFCATRSNVSPYVVTMYMNGAQIYTFNGNNSTNTREGAYLLGWGSGSNLPVTMHDFRIVRGSIIVPPSGGPDEPLEEVSGTFMTALSTGMNAFKCHTSSSDTTLRTKNFYQQSENNACEINRDTPYDVLEYKVNKHGGAIDFREQPSECYSIDLSNDTSLDLTGDFTVEFWVYDDSYSTNWRSILNFGAQEIYLMSGNLTTTGRIYGLGWNKDTLWQPKSWNHVAMVRNGTGTDNYKLYINGEERYDQTNTTTYATGNSMRIGANSGGSSERFRDIISDIRITNGTALYTSDFNPPIEPLPSTNATLHIKGTEASVVDKSGNTSLSLLGDTKCSTAQVKFAGSKSMYFDGSGDYINTNSNIQDAIGTQEYTAEAWIYCTSIANRSIFGSGSTDAADEFGLYLLSNGQIYHDIGGGYDYVQSSSGITVNTWHHLAVTRTSSRIDIWLDGTSVGSTTNTNIAGIDISGNSDFKIGHGRLGYWSGYIQDARLRIGKAEYTSTFTPPTAPLEG